MNTYQCCHPKSDNWIMIKADSSYQAQEKAAEHWKIKKRKDLIIIMLTHKWVDGKSVEVTHSTSEIG